MTQHVRLCGALVATLLLTALFGGLLLAAPTTPAAKNDTTKVVKVKAKQVVGEKAEGKVRLTTLSKAEVTQDDSKFVADIILVRSEDKVHEFTCTGNPVFTDPENRIIAEKVVAYSSPRFAEFTTNVKMVSTPKKTEGKTEKSEFKDKVKGEPTITTCDRLSYDYGEKRAKAMGHVVITQKTRTLWADEAVYEQKSELVTLTGNVRMRNAGEEELKELTDAATVTISLDRDYIDIVAKEDGFINMVFEVPEDDDKAPAKDEKKDVKSDEKKPEKK